MTNNLFGANVPVSGAEARPNETGVQNEINPAGQEEHDQATTAASAVESMPLHLVQGFNNN